MIRRIGSGSSFTTVGVARIFSSSASWGRSRTSMTTRSYRPCSSSSQIRRRLSMARRRPRRLARDVELDDVGAHEPALACPSDLKNSSKRRNPTRPTRPGLPFLNRIANL